MDGYPTCNTIAAVALPWRLLGLCGFTAAAACSGSGHARRLPAAVVHAARLEASGAHGDGSEWVEHSLHGAGLRFGTDGSARALWGYMRASHELVAAGAARPGDVVFFDVWGTAPEPSCRDRVDHAGIVESIDADGRIGFLERRGGRVLHSFVDPDRPTARRDDRGRILNSFLRPKLIAEPPGARHFAGEMICGVARVLHR